jgi:hypothetical protein
MEEGRIRCLDNRADIKTTFYKQFMFSAQTADGAKRWYDYYKRRINNRCMWQSRTPVVVFGFYPYSPKGAIPSVMYTANSVPLEEAGMFGTEALIRSHHAIEPGAKGDERASSIYQGISKGAKWYEIPMAMFGKKGVESPDDREIGYMPLPRDASAIGLFCVILQMRLEIQSTNRVVRRSVERFIKFDLKTGALVAGDDPADPRIARMVDGLIGVINLFIRVALWQDIEKVFPICVV